MKFLEVFKNRTVLGITCIVLALIICFAVSPLISRTSNKTMDVVRVTANIKSGDEITFICEGPDEEQALAKMVALVESGLGEN